MPEIRQLTSMFASPGIQRDGTTLDRNFFSDGQWVRFQRGRPRKMGGYQLISDLVSGPIRAQLVWSKGLMNALYNFSSDDITLLLMDQSGAGNNVYFLTPAGFVLNNDWVWTVDTMYDAAVGTANTIVIAAATPSMTNIDDDTASAVYWAVAGATGSAFAAIAGLTVSGGICVVGPYLVYYGANGMVGWSDVNQPKTLVGGDANSSRVTGSKVVKALQVRGGAGYAALLWSLDSVLKMDWVGGNEIFRFTTLTAQSSVLSQNGILEYDGQFFWVGVDRFMVYAGGSIGELPNDKNINWFFDNLNFAQRQKVWAMKIPRWGEIWWFFPFGDATECTHAVIYNVREKTWYDCALARSAGYYSQVFHYPVMGSAEENENVKWLKITITAGTFVVGDKIRGVTSAVAATITKVNDATNIIVYMTVVGTNFIAGEGLINDTSGATATFNGKEILCSTYVHEKGRNAVGTNTVNPIESYFETSDFSLLTGGSAPTLPYGNHNGPNAWTRIVRIEPDFVMNGEMSVVVRGNERAQAPMVESAEFMFDATTQQIDMREQRREIRLRFRNASIDGHYETGNVLLHLEPGDKRS